MKVSEAENLVCPLMSTIVATIDGDLVQCNRNCITEDCIFWKTTIKGKKEIDRKKEPYDMTPMDIRDWIRGMEDYGYENIGSDGGFRDVYVKYEETHEGYCTRLEK